MAETVEEAAENHANSIMQPGFDFARAREIKRDFVAGAAWQKEQPKSDTCRAELEAELVKLGKDRAKVYNEWQRLVLRGREIEKELNHDT